MIPAFAGTPSGLVRVLVATRPVDFRKGMGGLAALVKDELLKDPYSGVVYVFRAKRADRVKMIYWDGTGLWLLAKTLEAGAGVVRPNLLGLASPRCVPDFGQQPSLSRTNSRQDAPTDHLPYPAFHLTNPENRAPSHLV